MHVLESRTKTVSLNVTLLSEAVLLTAPFVVEVAITLGGQRTAYGFALIGV